MKEELLELIKKDAYKKSAPKKQPVLEEEDFEDDIPFQFLNKNNIVNKKSPLRAFYSVIGEVTK